MNGLKILLQALGRVVDWLAWPAYWVYIRRGGTRTRVVLKNKDEILMVKQWLGTGKWQLPGGGVHPGESLAEGAARELLEETGVKITPDNLKSIGERRSINRGIPFSFFTFAAQSPTRKVKKQDIELADIAWLHPAALNPENTRADALEAIKMVNGL